MRFFGASEDEIAEHRAGRTKPQFEVDRDNWELVNFFGQLLTQWRRSPMTGAPQGLDYAAVEALARILHFDLTPTTMADLQFMELMYIRESAELAKRNKPIGGAR